MSEVKLHIYDVSKGLAKSLSPMFLGRQIEAIWHTAIVVYGNEYFFGSAGIQMCQPGTTVLQQPDEIMDLGRTEMPKEVLDELLADLSQDRFDGRRYDLLRHNCNNFSDELSQFLTGRAIPQRITGLPAEVLATPFGAQLEQILGSVQRQLVDTQGYHYSTGQPQRETQSQPPAVQLPGPIRFAEPPADFAAPVAAASPDAPTSDGEELRWLDELSGGSDDVADGEARLAGLLRRTAIGGGDSCALASGPTAARFVAALDRLVSGGGGGGTDGRLAELAGRVACNAAGGLLGPGGVPLDRLAGCARRLLSMGGRPGLPEVGGALALNLMLLRPGNETLAFDLGCLLTDRLQALAASGAPTSAQLTLARALCAAARDCNQLAQLAAIQGVSLGHLATLCPHVARLHESVVRAQVM